MPEISFLIPTFNEEVKIISTVSELVCACAKLNLSYEIIIVNDASSDGTESVLSELRLNNRNIKVINNRINCGFSQSYQLALKEAKGDYCQYIPADHAINSFNLIKLLEKRSPNTAIVQYCLNTRSRKAHRFIISEVFTVLMNSVHYSELQYYNGLNIYPRSFLQEIDIHEKSFSFQAEILTKALEKLKIIQVPMNCYYTDSSSSALNWNNVFGVLKFCFFKLMVRSKL